jgi:hypothetical protein
MRIIALVVVLPATWYFAFWMSAAILSAFAPESVALWGGVVLAVAAAAGAGMLTWRGLDGADAGALRSTVLGAVLLGGIGFSAGFFGPILLDGGNQGPLLGIFITGPLGFVVGGTGGLITWAVRRRTRTGEAQ